MATPSKPWKAEYAKSGRSKCRTCNRKIEKDILRLGNMVQAIIFDGFIPIWNHASCVMKKAKQIGSYDDLEGIEELRWEDQQKIRQYVEGVGVWSSSTPAVDATKGTIEVSKSARATCMNCNEKIVTGEVRISGMPEGQGTRGLTWHHAKCFLDSSPTTQPENLDGWESLSDSNKSTVVSFVKKVSTTNEGKVEVKEEDETLKGSSKRKRAVDRDQKLKMARIEEDNKNHEMEPFKLQSLLEAQTNELWALKDDLKNHVSTAELREMLIANNQDSSGSKPKLLDRCVDGMLFGALKSCKHCKGHLHYSGGTYKCGFFIKEWEKCAYSTSEPDRVEGNWNIPEKMKNQYLKKWFKTQKANKPVRIMPQASPRIPEKPAANGTSQSSYNEKLADLKVSILNFSSSTMDEWKAGLKRLGCQLHPKVKKDTNCLVVCGVPDDKLHAEIRKARKMNVPIVTEDYLVDCLERQKKTSLDLYKIESSEEASESMVTDEVTGRNVVHESSGMQDTGHVLEHGKIFYNTYMTLCDLFKGTNSYYILQIIEDNEGSDCHLFRKWGRVGNKKIGGSMLEKMPKARAIQKFADRFSFWTGNSLEDWEENKLKKKPGKFYPLDMDYRINKVLPAPSKLAPPLAELMKMLFNDEPYQAAMTEFKIDMVKMPLGMLSKSNIQKGFEVLTELQNLLNDITDNPLVRENKIEDASNHFFTVIPSIHPHVIKDIDDVKSKVKMLEALQHIEIASKLIGLDSIDDKYKKLQCEMVALPHDSEDYRLVEKYLEITHAPTHTDWVLELEEVFTVDRRGELDKFSPYKDKLKNKMLLWHGSRLTNFVGILSQGLRIAPPEAPSSGYMFGKGIYFADLVSKSAQYCKTNEKNPVGLMLLSEVALGDMYELKKNKYMETPPRGKNSTKGLGKMVPDESGHVKWSDDIVVPCGKPVSSNVKKTELDYNEYIVYNPDQVKLQFLLKVRFLHQKRCGSRSFLEA